jgi:hypothetical protein
MESIGPRSLRLGIGAACLLAGTLHAQGATGKLQGRVLDDSGRPIADAQIFFVGSAFSAITGEGGHYFINSIPAGTWTVRAVYLGHRPVEVRGLRILADQTLTRDFTLTPAPLQLREIVVVAVENPLVPRDEVTSKQRIDGGFARDLPIDRVNELLALQPGVVADGDQISIRGGRQDEAVTYVDGVPVSPGYRALVGLRTQGTTLSVGTIGLEEASVITGSASAEYGNAQSGIISLVTRNVGVTPHGSLGYETDEPFGVEHGIGLNRVEASLGGPLLRNLTLFVSGVLEGRKSAEPGGGAMDAPVFVEAGVDTTVRLPSALDDPATEEIDEGLTADTALVNISRFAVARGRCDAFAGSTNEGVRSNYGLDCQGIRTPGTASSTYELQGKLSYSYGGGSRLALSYLASRVQGRDFDYPNLFNSPALFGFGRWSRILILNWSANLSRSAERALALDTYLSYQQDRTLSSPLTAESELRSRSSFGGFLLRPLRFRHDFDNFPITETLVHNYVNEVPGTRRTPYDLERLDTAGYALVDQFRDSPYGLRGFWDAGGPDGDLQMYREGRYLGRVSLDGQLDRFNRLKTGFEFTRYRIERYQSHLLFQTGDVYMERPTRWAAYIQNRLDLGDLVLVGGLRYDRYATGAERPFLLDTIPGSPNFGEYVPGQNPLYTGTSDEGKPLSIVRPDRWHAYLSPHIQVAFPVTARSNFRLSYAHQVQAPDFALMLAGVNAFGIGADIDFGKTIAFEFGVRHSFSDDMVVDVAAYNKDNIANPALRILRGFDPVSGLNTSFQQFTTADFGNSRGLDVRIDRRFGNWFNGTVGYGYQVAKNTGSDPFSNQTAGARALDQLADVIGPPPQAILTTTFSRPHSLTAALAVTVPAGWRKGSVIGAALGSVTVFSTARLTSGTAYTRCPDVPANAAVTSGEDCLVPGESRNQGRLPTFKQVDLRVTKGFALGKVDITAYFDIRNLFDARNLVGVFAATGGPASAGDRQNVWATDSASFAAEAAANGVFRRSDGEMDLRLGGKGASGCDTWVSAGAEPAVPNCVYLIRAEERFGDGDHRFTVPEQRRASDGLYAVNRGGYIFAAEPRRMRVGLEVRF